MIAFHRTKEDRGRRQFEILIWFAIFAAGCTFGSKTTYPVNQYTLEYPAPALRELTRIDEMVKVEKFSAAQAYDTSAIVYRDGPNLRNIDPYNRWRTKPAELIMDFLVRDLRHSGLFRAVFSYHGNEETRYLLEGQVNELMESREKDGLEAVLSLNLTFLDLSKAEVSERVIFQRDYRYTEPLKEETYRDLAHAMSKAMEKLSKQVIMDLHQAIRLSKK